MSMTSTFDAYCQRCMKLKRDPKSSLCHACAHQRSGSQLFKLKRRVSSQYNMAKVIAAKMAQRGMSAALDRFFKKD